MFMGLGDEQYDRQYSDRVLIRRIGHYLGAQKGRLALISLLVVCMSGLGALFPIVSARGVDWAVTSGQETAMWLIAGAMLFIGVTNWFLNWGRRYLTVKAIAEVVMELAVDAFDASVRHDLSFYDKLSSGKILSRITSDTRDFGQMIGLLTDLVSQVLESVILAVILFRLEWRLALIVMAIVPVIFLMAILYRSLARRVTKAGMQATATVNSTIKETVSGIAVAKNYRQENEIFNLFDSANQLSYTVNIRRGLVLSIVFPVLNLIGGTMTGILVYTGGMSATQGLISAGAWYAFILSLDRFMFPVMNLASFWTQVQSGLSAAERVFALIDAEPAVIQTDTVDPGHLAGAVTFEHVGFSYKEGEPVLQDFSLQIRPGENVALVGHTGAGKSSIARLVARYYEYQNGRILIDGKDIRTLSLPALRRNLGIVSQVPFLFAGSVLDNIRYTNAAVGREEVEEIAREVGKGEWLDTLTEGLDTEVGERGVRLSMGQRQLVSLMRVLVQKPAVFILDEATASVDPFTEWQIQQALNLILHRSTSILIAHRLSTVRSADRIVVIDHGKILEEGNHEGLLERDGHYARLYNTYFRHQSLNYRPAGLDDFLPSRQTSGAS